MAITLVQSKSATASGTSVSVTFDSPITAGNRIVLIVSSHGASEVTGSVGTDGLGNTYNRDSNTSVTAGSGGSTDNKLLEMYSAAINTGGSCTITYTVTASSGLSVVAQEWSGLFAGQAITQDGLASTGAGWIDHAAAEGAGTPPPYTMNFAGDFPVLSNYYGTTLPLVAISAGFNTSLTTKTQSFPNADRSVTVDWPTVSLLETAVFLVILYVGPVAPPVLRCGSPPTGTVGIAYRHAFPASGGAAPYTWVLTSGSLPTGLSLAALAGVVSGTPTAAGTSSFTITLTDSQGVAVPLACSITIIAAPDIGSFILDLWVWRRLVQFDNVNQSLQFPPGYERALRFALALEFYLRFPTAQQKYDYDEVNGDADAAIADLEILNASDAIALEPPE